MKEQILSLLRASNFLPVADVTKEVASSLLTKEACDGFHCIIHKAKSLGYTPL